MRSGGVEDVIATTVKMEKAAIKINTAKSTSPVRTPTRPNHAGNESVGIGKAEREVMEAIKIQRDISVFKSHPIADTEQKVREKDGKE